VIKQLFQLFFLGNFFCAICAVALCIETGHYFNYGPIQWLPLSIILCATIAYYNYAYMHNSYNNTNLRSIWYKNNAALIKKIHRLLLLLVGAGIVYFVVNQFNNIRAQKLNSTFLLLTVFVVGILYYPNQYLRNFSIRNTGWLKPFLIGYVWSGVVTILPLYCNAVMSNSIFYITPKFCLFFLVNFLFISALSIVFDIKDYDDDNNVQLKTLSIKLGILNVINYVVTPLVLGTCFLHIFYMKLYHYATYEIMIVPFYILTLWVINKLQKETSIFFYLIIIDGLMLLKALVGLLILP
jgi:4-hydroxybenzoate polyprenyltransferase